MVNNTFNYIGSVKISFKYPNKTSKKLYHNNGTTDLFRIISKAIAGETISEDRPAKIDLREGDGGEYVSFLSSPSAVSGLRYVNDGGWCVRMTSTIMKTQLRGTIDESKTYRFYLASNNTDLAYIQCSTEDLKRIENGAQAIIEWTLRFINPSNGGQS